MLMRSWWWRRVVFWIRVWWLKVVVVFREVRLRLLVKMGLVKSWLRGRKEGVVVVEGFVDGGVEGLYGGGDCVDCGDGGNGRFVVGGIWELGVGMVDGYIVW